MAKKILILVEGEKQDFKLMEHLFGIYLADENRIIVSYNTNIYELYGQLYGQSSQYDEAEFIDILSLLKSREKDVQKKKIFDERYTDIVLIFDFDPQDPLYDAEKLYRLLTFFNNSTDNGRLYINYPMVESFYHVCHWAEPPAIYNARSIARQELGTYKQKVNVESCCRDLRCYDKTRCNIVMNLNLQKVAYLLQEESMECDFERLQQVLRIECRQWDNQKCVSVLNTCILYFFEYNRNLLARSEE